MDRSGSAQDYKRDFWETENLRYSEPHFRLRKVAWLVRKLAGTREVDLLDVGCGPGTLAGLLPASVRYHGIDIAIQRPAPNLMELDITREAVGFRGLRFDIVVAQGVFEYLGDEQSRVLGEIAGLLTEGGRFVGTFQNFAHRRASGYKPYSNTRPPEDFRRDVDRYFRVDRAFPTAFNWGHSHPRRALIRIPQERLAVNVPVIGRRLAVDYCYICSPRSR
jgi:SAM-dependent methyltransferase